MRLNYIDNIDCLEGMKALPDGSVDMVLCDLPYGTTRNKWDTIIPFGELWTEYDRVCKPNAAIVLFSQPPFDKILAASNLNLFRYEWIWEKDGSTGFLNANKMPLKKTENILVFYKALPTYNPQKVPGKPYKCKRGSGSSSWNYDEAQGGYITENDGSRYPTNILKFNRDKDKHHPTQKPVSLCEYLIKTYTNPGETVLDNCVGSGTTAVACIRTGRNYIGFEIGKEYHEIAQNRVAREVDRLLAEELA